MKPLRPSRLDETVSYNRKGAAMDAKPLGIILATLGEGPVWHDGALWFVDIEGMALHRWHPGAPAAENFAAGDRIGFAVPSTADDWIVGLSKGLASWSPGEGRPEVFCDPEQALSNNRFNDGKVDPEGRLYAGTMDLDAAAGQGALYCLDALLRAEKRLDDVTISNGMAWDVSAERMYYVDSATRRVDCFAWDRATGQLSGRRAVIEFDKSSGAPDGMCIDANGQLWVALWGGSSVAIVDPTRGKCVGRIEVAAPHVSSCCFGGEQLDQLYITTARVDLSEDQLTRSPSSGDVFLATPGVTGSPSHLFRHSDR